VKKLNRRILPNRHGMPCPYKFRLRPLPIPYIIVCEKFMQFLFVTIHTLTPSRGKERGES
jgi:hypothetical protein